MTDIFQPEVHRRIAARKKAGPPKVADVAAEVHGTGAAGKFNAWLAIKITDGVGTMWCAYAFAVIALVSLPSVLSQGSVVGIVSWIAQTFLQLVLLSIIIVGQNIMAAASDKRSEATYDDADAILHTAEEIQRHLAEQDKEIGHILTQLRGLTPA